MVAESCEILVLASPGSRSFDEEFERAAAALIIVVPFAAVEHVGSTAIPGSPTKGDLDILVRVDRTDFGRAQVALDAVLSRSQRNEPTDCYCEYDFADSGVLASVQLCVTGEFQDRHFRGLKSVLVSDPEALRLYNDLKAEYEGREMAEYRRAKERLIESFLSRYGNGVDLTVRPGIYG